MKPSSKHFYLLNLVTLILMPSQLLQVHHPFGTLTLAVVIIWAQTQSISETPIIYRADNSQLPVSHIGNVRTSKLSLPNTLLVPKLSLNLFSVGQLCELGLDVHFSSRGCLVQDPKKGQILGTGCKEGRLFTLTSLNIPSHPSHSILLDLCGTTVSSEVWHFRLGHVSFQRLNYLISSGVLGSVKHQPIDYVSCQLAKHHALPFNDTNSISSAPFDLIHFDI